MAAGDDELAWQLRTGHESVQEAAPRQLRTDAELDAVEAAIEAREEQLVRLERVERRVLVDVLQAEWSDATFAAEWARLEAEEETCAEVVPQAVAVYVQVGAAPADATRIGA